VDLLLALEGVAVEGFEDIGFGGLAGGTGRDAGHEGALGHRLDLLELLHDLSFVLLIRPIVFIRIFHSETGRTGCLSEIVEWRTSPSETLLISGVKWNRENSCSSWTFFNCAKHSVRFFCRSFPPSNSRSQPCSRCTRMCSLANPPISFSLCCKSGD
jgi:hypothetical protein